MVERVAAVAKDPRCNWDCMLGGQILGRGRVNVTVVIQFRMSPTGPWFTQRHKVPRAVILGGIFCEA